MKYSFDRLFNIRLVATRKNHGLGDKCSSFCVTRVVEKRDEGRLRKEERKDGRKEERKRGYFCEEDDGRGRDGKLKNRASFGPFSSRECFKTTILLSFM